MARSGSPLPDLVANARIGRIHTEANGELTFEEASERARNHKNTIEDYKAEKYLENSSPCTSLMEARAMWIRHFDPETNMATFSVADLHLGNRHHNDVEFVFLVCGIVKSVLRSMHESQEAIDPAELQVGVAGSAALLLLERIMRQSHRNSARDRGRWRSLLVPNWKANDVDVFVAGPSGQDEETFEEYTGEFIGRAFAVARNHHTVVSDNIEHRRHLYVVEGERISIVDMKFQNIDPKLSIVQAPHAGDLVEVIRDFDIQVAKVIYNVETGLIHADLETVWAIERGISDVTPVRLNRGHPSTYQAARISSTFQRLTKYGKRGYRFNDYPNFAQV